MSGGTGEPKPAEALADFVRDKDLSRALGVLAETSAATETFREELTPREKEILAHIAENLAERDARANAFAEGAGVSIPGPRSAAALRRRRIARQMRERRELSEGEVVDDKGDK